MVSIDLSDDYYSVSMALIDQKYLLFKLEGQLYKSVCVPNGLTSAPRIFTKLLKPVFSALHRQGHQTLHKKMKFSIKDFLSKCDQIRRKLRIWSHLRKKSLMESFIFMCSEIMGYLDDSFLRGDTFEESKKSVIAKIIHKIGISSTSR